MSSIGPQIPAHLLQSVHNDNSDDEEDDGPQPAPNSSTNTSIGPQIPTHLQSSGSKLQVIDDDDDEGPVPAPAPQKRAPTPPRPQRPMAGPSMPPGPRTIGPTFPNYAPTYDPNFDEEDSDDDDFGPKPLPAGMQHEETDAVKEFIEREEKRRKAAEDAAKPKAPQRDEWMLVPPTSSGLLGNLDTTKLKARQFSRGTTAQSTSKNDTSLWTETPAERQQRLADEVSGKKRRVTDAPAEDEDTKTRRKRRKAEEESIRQGVEQHTKQRRGAALVEQHEKTGKKPADEPEIPGIWDHSRDMGLGGRLMDDDKRKKMLQEAKGLGDRFGSGKGGGFL